VRRAIPPRYQLLRRKPSDAALTLAAPIADTLNALLPAVGALGPGLAEISRSGRCTKPSATVYLTFSKRNYSYIRGHYIRAVRKGWPRVLVVRYASLLRDRLLEAIATKPAHDLTCRSC
jgi:hypothetical protein